MTSDLSLLLVGATGRVGRMVCRHWPQIKGAPDLVVTQRHNLPQAGKSVLWSPLDGPESLRRQLQDAPVPSALVMLAGVTPAPGVDESALALNRSLAEGCLRAATGCGIGRVLLASSSAVYGIEPNIGPFAEGMPPNPISAYGRAKLDMEAVAHNARDSGLDVCCLRIGNVAGADALLGPLTGRLVDPTNPLRIDAFADALGPLRSYIGPASLARVLAVLASAPDRLPDVLNVATPVPVRMVDLAKAAGWPYVLQPAPASAVQSITLDCRLLNRLCPMSSHDSLPDVMVEQWKASWR